jgi:hypothetical protein
VAQSEQKVPEWLRAMPSTQETAEAAAAAAAATTEGSGLQREVLAEPLVTQTFASPAARNVHVRPPRAGSVEALSALLQPADADASRRNVTSMSLLTEPLAASRARPGGLRRWFLPDGLIYLSVLAVLLAVLLIRPPFGDISAPTAQGTLEFYSMIENVPEDRPVLVAYDWDATRSAEMSILSEAVMRHLMARRLRFVTVSTVPQGPGFAQQVTDSIIQDPDSNYGYEYGSNYLVLGYLPGNEVALRALVTNFSQAMPLDYKERNTLSSYQIMQGGEIQGVSDFALIVDLASEEADLRNWIEQVAVRSGVPIIAAVPQSLDPIARPYTNLPVGGLQAVISGPTGALQYNRQLELQGRLTAAQGSLTALTDRLNAQSVAQLLVGIVILAALVGMASRRILRR